ncbi:helix-turn-helix domain-containing protein [Metabacillus idriensis]|uniref:helix-turn-helix domain-containing protein n=1 Tax=Metabacillus idriensis TaxID=324768 RepID=UPI001749DE08|nr:helix-turn-helix transcriptional regulator [Metabacillus idriensis]
MLDKKVLGRALQIKRKDLKLTQIYIANVTGLSRNYISDIENGRYMPSADALYKIASCLNFDLNILKMTEIQVVRRVKND